jgi:hypothetical protein
VVGAVSATPSAQHYTSGGVLRWRPCESTMEPKPARLQRRPTAGRSERRRSGPSRRCPAAARISPESPDLWSCGSPPRPTAAGLARQPAKAALWPLHAPAPFRRNPRIRLPLRARCRQRRGSSHRATQARCHPSRRPAPRPSHAPCRFTA